LEKGGWVAIARRDLADQDLLLKGVFVGMKKLKNCLFIFCFVSFAVGGVPLQARAAITGLPSFQHLASNLASPEDIAKFIWRHFQVESDQAQFGTEDRWQSPEELLKSERGDCEDFALFAYEIFKARGTQAFLLNIYGASYGHTVCVFKEGNSFHAVDGTNVVRGGESLEILIAKIQPFWKTAAIVKALKSSGRGIILKKITR